MKIVAFNGQYRITLPKDLVEDRNWNNSTKLRVIETLSGSIILRQAKSGRKIVSYNNQYRLTLPKHLVEDKNWKKGTKIRFLESNTGDLVLKIVGGKK